MFSLLLLVVLAAGQEKVVDVRSVDVPPVIDGAIEERWTQADSAYGFFQFEPNESEPPTEKTVVYVLQDDENLYFAIRCHAVDNKPVRCLTSDEDYVAVGIDPFGSKTTAYYFMVYASEIMNDGWILDDGRTMDGSWEGVWFRAARVFDDRWELELRIPFKSIRYKHGLREWGMQVLRYSASNRETDYWAEASQVEGDMVSRWGTLRGIEPKSAGYYFELYPEGFVRYDKHREGAGSARPRLSMNFKWDLTPQTTLNATAYPDFAQIESDPFTLNLSRYPTYLSERRPFFLEGDEIFRMSDFGEGRGFFRPLDTFYSRRIGKSLNGEVVPILGGLKLTTRSETWNAGVLASLTDDYFEHDSLVEPRRTFGAVRLKHRVLENSTAGILMSGMIVDGDDYNYAAGFDGVYRQGIHQFILQGAASDRSGKKGWALASGYSGMIGGFLTMGAAEAIQDSFDVGEIGFVPWAGRKRFMLLSGPFRTYEKGFLRNLYVAPGVVAIKEPENDDWSVLGHFILNPNFRNRWGFNLEMSAGPYYEADTIYFFRTANFSSWGSIGGQFVNVGGSLTYEYNYSRQFLAYQGGGWFRVGYGLIPEISLSLSGNTWVEWDTSNTIAAITTRASPRIDCRVNADVLISLFNEFVVETPGSDIAETDWLANRIGLLVAWNFSPKSWLYLALNDYRARNDRTGNLELENEIAAVKVKYLVYF